MDEGELDRMVEEQRCLGEDDTSSVRGDLRSTMMMME